jgi:hypothetical protein
MYATIWGTIYSSRLCDSCAAMRYNISMGQLQIAAIFAPIQLKANI